MSEERRLKIAKRQEVLAQIAQREARFALASALVEEARSSEVCTRARTLLREYEQRLVHNTAALQSHTLQSNLAFVRSLQSMADNADETHKDARDQAEWQMQTLAKAETKLSAHEERVAQEKRSLEAKRERREIPAELTGGAKGRSRSA